MITGEHVTVIFEDRNGSFTALDDVSFEINDGEFVCIVGHSGCGKTTLLRVISGLQEITSGSVKINGKEIAGPGSDRTVVFQQYSLFPWMTALRNVCFGIEQAGKITDKKEILQRAEYYLEKVGMKEFKDRYPFQLSGGMRQRVAIARAFAVDSEIFLLDEPFGALDARARASLQQLLLDMREGSKEKTVIFITHDIDEAILLADRIIFMKPGKIESSTPVYFTRPRVKEILLHEDGYCHIRQGLIGKFYENNAKEE